MRASGRAAVLILAATLGCVACSAAAAAAGGTPRHAAADRDCSDFPNQRAAQNYFLAKGGPKSDPDNLDSDGDGIACETNPCPCKYSTGGGGHPTHSAAHRIRGRIVRVVDGDTLYVRGQGGKRRLYDVRLIGIDTPEKYGGLECGARRASRSMRRLAPAGLRVTLVTDPSQDLRDRYGRLLAYVDRRRDGADINRAQVARGWAEVYVFDRPFRRLHSYRRAARRARNADRGVWGRCGGHFHSPLGSQ
jgi:endonuclease YncB( thermonuclease family)